MKREEILTLPAGTKINQLVWWAIFEMRFSPPNNDMKLLPDYSRDMSAAWQILKKLPNGRFFLELGSRQATVKFSGYSNEKVVVDGIPEDVAPLAICRAALLAVMCEGAVISNV